MTVSRIVLAAVLTAFPSAGLAAGADDAVAEPRQPVQSRLPAGIEVSADSFQETSEGEIVLDGAVTLRWRGARFQADRIRLRERRFVEAEGNVLVVWAGNRVSGSSMTYDLETERGVILDAVGRVEPEFYFRAERVEKIGDDEVLLKSANVTTCTQPVPYWSFSISSARIRAENYARMWNLRLKAKKMPVFYLPYMIWPVKEDRSVGLLFPDFGSTEDRGQVVSQALFIPIGRSTDVTLVGEYYTEAGLGGGAEARFVPNRKGFGIFNGFFIEDKVADTTICSSPPCARWRASYRQTQEFQNGFRMIADINEISDFDYFSDFERDLRLVSSPSVLARLEFSRNGAWTSVNVREFRREQLVDDPATPDRETLVQQTLPEIELRGRERRLGKTPVYVSYETSLTSIRQDGPTIDADYVRGDFFPSLSVTLSRVPWLDINPVMAYRWTYWSQRRDPVSGEILDDNLTRGVGAAGIEIVGPKFVRIFERRNGTRFKNLIEPNASYAFRQSFDETGEIIRYDEVDLVAPQNLVTYGIRSRLFLRRPRAESPLARGSGEDILMPGAAPSPSGLEPEPPLSREGLGAPLPRRTGPTEPLEIATLDLTQRRSLDDLLTCADLDGDGIAERSSKSSPVTLTGRLNPNPFFSVDVRAAYHPLYEQVQDVSLSGSARGRNARVGFSLVRREGRSCSVSGSQLFATERDDDTQLALSTGFVLFGGKIRIDLDGSYTSNPGPGLSKIPQRRIRAEYYTQCCGFLAEYLERDYAATRRQDIRFTVDLRGIGKFLDLHHGQDR